MKKTLHYAVLYLINCIVVYYLIATLFGSEATTHFIGLISILIAALMVIVGHFFAEYTNANPIIKIHEIEHPLMTDGIAYIHEQVLLPDTSSYYLPSAIIRSNIEIGKDTIELHIVIPEENLGTDFTEAKLKAQLIIAEHMEAREKEMLSVINATMTTINSDMFIKSVERK